MFLLNPLIGSRYGRYKLYNLRETQNIEHKINSPHRSWSEQSKRNEKKLQIKIEQLKIVKR